MKPSERSVKSVIALLEDNPGQWWPKMLDSLGNVDTAEAHLLLQQIIDDLHPTAAAQCCKIARRRCGVIFQHRS